MERTSVAWMQRSGIQGHPASPVVCYLDSAALHPGYEQFGQQPQRYAPWIPLRCIQATSSSAGNLSGMLPGFRCAPSRLQTALHPGYEQRFIQDTVAG
jgi:hypothetical protein